MKKKYIFVLLLICSLLIVGCGKKEIEYEKHLISFSYDYGNDNQGYHTYNISVNKDNIIYSLSESTSYVRTLEIEIDESYIDRLDKLINKYDILDWDGFNKQKDDKDSDEIAFSIHIGYDNGDNCSATGYRSYPDNFNKVHKELIKIFNELNNIN